MPESLIVVTPDRSIEHATAMNADTSRQLRFYFDFISHNAYLAWTQIFDLAARHGMEVTPIPVLFAGLLQQYGQLGPAEVPPKLKWMTRDVLRKATRLGVPLKPPRSHPFNPLLGLRLASLPLAAPVRQKLIDVLFGAVWAGGPGVTEPEAVRDLLDAAGFNGAELLTLAAGDEAKARVRADTDAAIALGVFGVPTMLVGTELFWGFDDLGHLEQFLAGNDPLPVAELAAWSAVKPSAQRT